MHSLVEIYRDKWAESVALNAAARARMGEEKYALEVLKAPIADESTAMFEQVKQMRSDCKDMALDYFEAVGHSAEFAGLNQEHLVSLIDIARAQNNEERVVVIDMYLIANFEPQIIRGNFRLPSPGAR